MKATINKVDPIERRMQRGRRIARGCTLAALIGVGVTAVVNPGMFSSKLPMPTAEERDEAKKQRKKKKASKPKSRLTKKDIERLAKLRESKARKQMIEILVRLEKRIIIAEVEEARTTAKYRKSEGLFDSLANLLSEHVPEFGTRAHREIGEYRVAFWRAKDRDELRADAMTEALAHSIKNNVLVRTYRSSKAKSGLDAIQATAKQIESLLSRLEEYDVVLKPQTLRYLKSILSNAEAISTENRDLAVRGFAQPEDHPLNKGQRKNVRATCKPMSMNQLHQLSQEMAAHYTNLMGDVEAGELAAATEISFPEALDKLAHEPFAKDDLKDSLDQSLPGTSDELEGYSDALNEAQASAARALREADGEVPGEEGKDGEGDEGEGGDKSGDAEDGDGPFGSGGGNGTENSSEMGDPSGPGQRSKEAVWRSLALKSSLAAAQDRGRSVNVNSKQVLANVLPGRRFTSDSPRKGYLFIDTWHIIGPWDVSVPRHGEINFSRIYPVERKLDLDAVFTTGKTDRLFDDERGYAGKGTLNGRLTWQFYQSPTVEVRIPREQLANDALYFAYTEVFFEKPTVMNLAIGSDDAARIRVNGEVVFQDTGLSPYVIAEQVRQVKFKQGLNKILVRLVNGPGPCRFSLLLMPSE